MSAEKNSPAPESQPTPADAAQNAAVDANAQRIAELEKKVASLEAALADEKDKLLRKVAEFDTTRRRLHSDAEKKAESKKLDFILQMFDVTDALEMALMTPADKETVEHLSHGVRLTLEKFYQILRESGVEKCKSLGTKFDPAKHEAVSSRTDEQQADQIILQVYREGFVRGDQVIRHAQVVVNQR